MSGPLVTGLFGLSLFWSLLNAKSLGHCAEPCVMSLHPLPGPVHCSPARAPAGPTAGLAHLALVLAQEESLEVPSCSHPVLSRVQGWPQAGVWVAMSDFGCAHSGDLRRPGLR